MEVLQDAMTRGLLTHDEGGDRMAAAFAARFRDELPPLTTDLPPAPVPGPTAPSWRGVGSMAATQLRWELQAARAGGLRSPRIVAALLAAVVLVVLLGALVGLGLHGLFDGGFGPPDGGFGPR